ncbi:MAG TPA: beta-ketoacyl-ACP synthase II [Bacteroidota bacterium]|nr:beta-ketoacyl-ACP synthase II [Bacteroidota bacterium]
MRSVVVTGIGLITPIGLSTEESWGNCLAGRSGIGPVTRFSAEQYPTRIAGEIKGFDTAKYFEPKEARRLDIFNHYAVGAGLDALKDSNLVITPQNAERVGIIIGSGIGGVISISETAINVAKEGPRHVTPFFIPGAIINMPSGYLAIRTGAKGPNYAVVSACATGNHAIADGFHTIRRGEADAMIVGGSEASVTEVAFAGFCSAKAMSRRNDEPQRASRPFDKDRDGFVLGEGASVLVLEEEDHARKRGVKIYARMLSCGMTADAFHITAPPDDGEGAQRAMKLAVEYAGLKLEQIDYINAHGTSTGLGDAAETKAVKKVFGAHAKKLAISSTKSMIGHLLGAAGAAEAAFTVLALRDGVLPPTINLDNPDPECDLDYVPNHSRKRDITYALSNGFGFGGTNATVCFEKVG